MAKTFEIREFVDKHTKGYGIGELENQPTKIQEQLIIIETFIQDFVQEQANIVQKMKEYEKINLLSISTGSGVPRSSIYNSPNTLQVYIERRCKEIEKQDILGVDKLTKTKKKDKELQELFSGLQQEVIDSCELKCQIKELESDLASYMRQCESKQKQIFELESLVKRLQKKSEKQNHSSKVVPLKREVSDDDTSQE